MTNAIKDKRLPVPVFLEDIEFTMGWREKLTYAALERDGWEILFSVFSVTDRVQHMMFKFHDEEHPKHDPDEAAQVVQFFGEPTALKDVIPAIYKQMDRVVGAVMGKIGPDDTLLLCADHGFTSFRREMHVNNWLAEKGYLAIKSDVSGRGTKQLDVVDWSKTKAYSLGLGMVFLNLEGREPYGIVTAAEADALMDGIEKDFLETYDEIDGVRHKVGRDVFRIEGNYEGPYRDRCADLMLGFEEYYRTSWPTAGGQIRLEEKDGEIVVSSPFRDNASPWCGDHASVSPHIVTGVFFSSKPVVLPEDGVSVLHVAPTVLALAGVPIPADYDRPALELR